MKILVAGPLLVRTGYGAHARQICKALIDAKLDVSTVHFSSLDYTELSDSGFGGLAGEIYRRMVFEGHFDLMVVIAQGSGALSLLDNISDKLTATRKILFSAFMECWPCNPNWMGPLSKNFDGIYPISTYTLDCLKATPGFEKIESKTHIFWHHNLRVVPNHVTKVESTDKAILIDGELRYLSYDSTSLDLDRKQILRTLETCCEYIVESGRDDISIMMKTSAPHGSNRGLQLAVKQLIYNFVKSKFSKIPRININTGYITDEELQTDFYGHPNTACFASMTHAEGLGAGVLLAAEFGLPIVAAPKSGYMDFLKDYTNFFPCGFTETLVPEEKLSDEPMTEFYKPMNPKWYTVDKKSFKDQLHKALNSPRVEGLSWRTPEDYSTELRGIVDEQKG